MKSTIINALKELVKDRYLLIILIVFLIISLAYIITIGLSIHPSERQVISHYTAFGITRFYFDQWFYLLSFVGFGLIVAISQAAIAVKLMLIKGRSLAIAYVWLGIGIVLIGWSTAETVLSLRTLL